MLQDPSPPTALATFSAVHADRQGPRGRGVVPSFDAARSSWAESFRVQPDDGLYLGEVGGGPINLEQIVEALEACGKTRKDALTALERLFDAGLISTACPV